MSHEEVGAGARQLIYKPNELLRRHFNRKRYSNDSSRKSLANGLQKCMATAWQTGDTCSDFDVIVDGTTFRCHKYLLNATSGFFKALFRSGMKETIDNRVELKMMSGEVFEVIVKALYTGAPGLNGENVLDVWQACHQLEIQYLSDECEQFASDALSADNCVEFYYFAHGVSSKKVSSRAHEFMVYAFEAMIHSEGFLQMMTPDVFEGVIGDEFLKASSENVVVDSILRWVNYRPESGEVSADEVEKYDGLSDTLSSDFSNMSITTQSIEEHVSISSDDRERHLHRLLNRVKLLLVSEEWLRNLEQQDIIQRSPECRDLVKRAISFTSRQEPNVHAWQESTTHRFFSLKEHAVVIMTSSKVLVYRLHKHPKFYEVATLIPISSYLSRKMCVFQNKIYIEELTYDYYSLITIDEAKTKEVIIFHESPQLYTPSTRGDTAKLFSHNRSLYRYFKGALYRLEKRSNVTQWVFVYQSDDIKSTTEVVCFENLILFVTNTKKNATVYGLDPESLVCRRTSDLPGEGWLLITFKDGDGTYVIQSDGALTRIHQSDDSAVGFEFIARLWDVAWYPLSAVTYCGKLYIFGKDWLVPLDVQSMRQKVIPKSLSFEKIEVVKEDDSIQCSPMVVTRDWFQ